eukprot:TRINITY_DN3341_c0_g1_i2.p1 TRINITY_DN3341_c0_g1~~TRINITY_DN3341_c0_g1_i2.p1  ORF type:complete len:169 (-),score=17.66 TRINITY_DN3341_c0_g1_i2:64-570(-)
MTDAISSLSSLSHLQLHLYGDLEGQSITDKMMKSICAMLHSLISLSHLNLGLLSNYKITDSGMLDFSKGLCQLVHLISFQISLRDTQTSDEGVSHVMDAIQSLQHLSLLHLDLDGCRMVTDVGGHKIGEVVLARTSLIDVYVNVGRTGISEGGVANLRSVQRLSLIHI